MRFFVWLFLLVCFVVFGMCGAYSYDCGLRAIGNVRTKAVGCDSLGWRLSSGVMIFVHWIYHTCSVAAGCCRCRALKTTAVAIGF